MKSALTLASDSPAISGCRRLQSGQRMHVALNPLLAMQPAKFQRHFRADTALAPANLTRLNCLAMTRRLTRASRRNKASFAKKAELQSVNCISECTHERGQQFRKHHTGGTIKKNPYAPPGARLFVHVAAPDALRLPLAHLGRWQRVKPHAEISDNFRQQTCQNASQ
jgi:hypothetical protein